MGESKLLLALFCNKILTKSEQGVVVVVISWRSGCVTLTVTLQLYRGGECVSDIFAYIFTIIVCHLSKFVIYSIFCCLFHFPEIINHFVKIFW